MNICIIGSGNVGSHLANGFSRAGVDTHLINSRNLTGVPDECDTYIITVKDAAIKEVAESVIKLIDEGKTVVHTSGSVGIEVLQQTAEKIGKNIKCGVMYPMQTFSIGADMKYADIPFLIEGDDNNTESQIVRLAKCLSRNVLHADSAKRGEYHLAAVMACNFSVYLCNLAEEYLNKKGGDFKLLLPLMRQTVEKLGVLSPSETLTGPARRGDVEVIENHLDKLSDNPEAKEVYDLITKNIIKKYE